MCVTPIPFLTNNQHLPPSPHPPSSPLPPPPPPSLDQEEAAFRDYFEQMPWLALPFDGDEREQFMNTYQVGLATWFGGEVQGGRD
jgi:hypothetical protein